MNPASIPLLQMLKNRLGYLSERQSVVAQNVANADTPGFKPSDLTPFRFRVAEAAQGGPGAPTRTKPMHLPGPVTSASGARVVAGAESERSLGG
jgi:flagellar basal-body rod protein FlgB